VKLKNTIIAASILAAIVTPIVVNAATAEDQCKNPNSFEFSSQAWVLSLWNIAKWEVANGVDCTVVPGIKEKLSGAFNDVKSMAMQYALKQIAGFLPFGIPISGLMSTGENNGTTAILAAIHELENTVKQQNSNLVGYNWLVSLRSIEDRYSTWNNMKLSDDPAAYSDADDGYTRVLKMRDDVGSLLTQFDIETQDVAIKQTEFFHIYTTAVQLYIDLDREYQTYRVLATEPGFMVKDNQTAQNLLQGKAIVNGQEVYNEATLNKLNNIVTARIQQNIATRLATGMAVLIASVKPKIAKNATNSLANFGYGSYPDMNGGGDWNTGGFTYGFRLLSYKVGNNLYFYRTRCLSNGSNCKWVDATENGVIVKRDFMYQFANITSLGDFIKSRAYDAYYTNAYANLIPIIRNWSNTFRDTWDNKLTEAQRKAVSTQISKTYSLDYINNPSAIISTTSNPANTSMVFGLTGFPTAYYQPLGIEAKAGSVFYGNIPDQKKSDYVINAAGLSNYITHVEVSVDIEHAAPTELSLQLTKPNGQIAYLREYQTQCDWNNIYGCDTQKDIKQTFVVPVTEMSTPNGKYTLSVYDKTANGNKAKVNSWQLIFK
jgi:hypothetical protein